MIETMNTKTMHDEITIGELTEIILRSFEEVTRNFNLLHNKIDNVESRLTKRIDDLDIKLSDRIDAVGYRIDKLTLDKLDRSEHTNLVKKLTVRNVL